MLLSETLYCYQRQHYISIRKHLSKKIFYNLPLPAVVHFIVMCVAFTGFFAGPAHRRSNFFRVITRGVVLIKNYTTVFVVGASNSRKFVLKFSRDSYEAEIHEQILRDEGIGPALIGTLLDPNGGTWIFYEYVEGFFGSTIWERNSRRQCSSDQLHIRFGNICKRSLLSELVLPASLDAFLKEN